MQGNMAYEKFSEPLPPKQSIILTLQLVLSNLT